MATVTKRRKYQFPDREAAETAYRNEEANGSRYRQFVGAMCDSKVHWFRGAEYDVGVVLRKYCDALCGVVHHPDGQACFVCIYDLDGIKNWRRSLWDAHGPEAIELRGLMDDVIGQYSGKFAE